MSISLSTIAKVCGVSTATVSRALANPPRGRMSDEVRCRIRAMAKTYGYSVNPTARSLRLCRTESILLVLPPYFSCVPLMRDFDAHVRLIQWEMIFGITDAAAQAGYDVRLMPLRPEELQQPNAIFNSRHGDGAIFLFALSRFPHLEAAIGTDFPHLSVDFTSNEYACDLRADFHPGYLEACDDLKRREKYRIGLMFNRGEKHSDHMLDFLTPTLERSGFLEIRSLDVRNTIDIRRHVAKDAYRGLDAIFCLNDTVGGLLREEIAFIRPRDVLPEIIGMDNNPVYLDLSTIGVARLPIAQEAVRRLIDGINGAKPEEPKSFPSYYIKRI